MMSLQELSGEGSLEGFHDVPTPDDEVNDGCSGPELPRQHNFVWFSWIEQGLGALSTLLVSSVLNEYIRRPDTT